MSYKFKQTRKYDIHNYDIMTYDQIIIKYQWKIRKSLNMAYLLILWIKISRYTTGKTKRERFVNDVIFDFSSDSGSPDEIYWDFDF